MLQDLKFSPISNKTCNMIKFIIQDYFSNLVHLNKIVDYEVDCKLSERQLGDFKHNEIVLEYSIDLSNIIDGHVDRRRIVFA